MKNYDIKALPREYKNAVRKELQGTITEATYSIMNYVDKSRRLVTDQNINHKEAGRDTEKGASITKKCNVYLPAGYDKNNKSTKYDVIYLLHGVGGSSYEWLSSNGKADGNYIICNIFDNLIEKGDINPVIVVFPEGRSAHDWRDTSFNPAGTNLLGFYYFDYELRHDLIPFIEGTYHTYADISDTSKEGIAYNRLHRALAGLSMGGMQALNLGLGGERCDSEIFTGTEGEWKNGLDRTVAAPGMSDLFAYIGAFSNAPTSSEGKLLGMSLAASEFKLQLLYISCGDADEVAYQAGYTKAVEGLSKAAGEQLVNYYRVLIQDGKHDFMVWNNGAYNFARLIFKNIDAEEKPVNISLIIEEKEC